MLCGLLLVNPVLGQPLPLGATINWSGSTITGVTLRVWAPNATAVALRGQFNNWGGTAMTKDNATDYWTATVANARPNQEYHFSPLARRPADEHRSHHGKRVDARQLDWGR